MVLKVLDVKTRKLERRFNWWKLEGVLVFTSLFSDALFYFNVTSSNFSN